MNRSGSFDSGCTGWRNLNLHDCTPDACFRVQFALISCCSYPTIRSQSSICHRLSTGGCSRRIHIWHSMFLRWRLCRRYPGFLPPEQALYPESDPAYILPLHLQELMHRGENGSYPGRHPGDDRGACCTPDRIVGVLAGHLHSSQRLQTLTHHNRSRLLTI